MLPARRTLSRAAQRISSSLYTPRITAVVVMRQLTAASSATTDNDHNVFSSTAAAAADDDDDYDDRVGHTLKIAKRGARLVDEKYPFSNGILDR